MNNTVHVINYVNAFDVTTRACFVRRPGLIVNYLKTTAGSISPMNRCRSRRGLTLTIPTSIMTAVTELALRPSVTQAFGGHDGAQPREQ